MAGITLDFADGSYEFRLTWAGCAEVERKCGDGPHNSIMAIYERVANGHARTVEIVEILRQGLIGGSGGVVDGQPVECTPAVINGLLARYVTGNDAVMPITEAWQVAQAVLMGALVGYPPAQKKSETPETETTATGEST
ncbi:gene transfer agent family protein [Sphingomonas sp.]|uniref:gene transfer agent family protein n=1 Tax=Sphingomonas sp. TaxID=28214 RepID=UPI003F716C31